MLYDEDGNAIAELSNTPRSWGYKTICSADGWTHVDITAIKAAFPDAVRLVIRVNGKALDLAI
jgi:hypothetical protein